MLPHKARHWSPYLRCGGSCGAGALIPRLTTPEKHVFGAIFARREATPHFRLLELWTGAASSLSRAYQRLEDRQYIARFRRGWRLADSNPYDNGLMLAFLVWAHAREPYALMGLKVHRSRRWGLRQQVPGRTLSDKG
jgi:hypothetical protein